MTVRDENMKHILEMLEQLDTLNDSLQSILRNLRTKVEIMRRGIELEAELNQGNTAHPPDPLDLELEDPSDDD